MTMWNCRCACGTERAVSRGSLLKKATKHKSCGCFITEFNVARNTTHGLSDTPEYNVWCKMRDRCANPAVKNFADYGGRGISVCDRWRDDYATFYADMGPRPTPQHEIDRIDNDGPYAPDNCRWATHLEQANNKRNNVRLTFRGESLTVAEWARRMNLTVPAIWLRVNRRKWPIEKALTTPLNATKHDYLTLNGTTRSIKEWTALLGGSKHAIHERLKHGWSVERALTTPVR